MEYQTVVKMLKMFLILFYEIKYSIFKNKLAYDTKTK